MLEMVVNKLKNLPHGVFGANFVHFRPFSADKVLAVYYEQIRCTFVNIQFDQIFAP